MVRLPCSPVFSKHDTRVTFEVPIEIVERLVRPYFDHGALMEVLSVDEDTLLNVLRAAVLSSKACHERAKLVRKTLEREVAWFKGEEQRAAEHLVGVEKEKEGAAVGVGVQLLSAVRAIASETPYRISQYVFMETVIPAVRTIVNDSVYLAWTETLEDIIKSPGQYISASHLAMDYVFFDIETTGLLPDGRMTCGVTQNGDDVRTWASPASSSEDGKKSTETSTYQLLTEETANELVEYLYTFAEGKRVVTFNGASFDFRVLLLHLSDEMMRDRCIEIAKNHFDLHLACIESGGHRMAMNGLVLATLGDKSKSGCGLDAINWWNDKDYDNLFEYCKQDVLLLKLLWSYAADNSMLFYLPKRQGASRKAVSIEHMDRSAYEFSPNTFIDY